MTTSTRVVTLRTGRQKDGRYDSIKVGRIKIRALDPHVRDNNSDPVALGITAPKSIAIVRGELFEKVRPERE